MRNELIEDWLYEAMVNRSENEEHLLLEELSYYYFRGEVDRNHGKEYMEAFKELLERTNYPREKFMEYRERKESQPIRNNVNRLNYQETDTERELGYGRRI